ncbi:MAG TPA: UbiA family prenyltransferase [Chitinivibrionales bacterium]|nr:UbiA family prenyltransferase [Chitinivibrionales bacterium]
MRPVAFVRILRPVNLLMLALGVALGFWLAFAPGGLTALGLLALAAAAAAGFGNVVNDIADIATDRVSHPGRPLASGAMSKNAAIVYATVLAAASAAAAFAVSIPHGAGVVVPLCLLLAYALFFKATPLAGNVLVSLLVAYGIVFGGLLGPGLHRLIAPAVLAFLLNLPREIVKDIQDRQGDAAAGYVTSAALPRRVLTAVIAVCGLLYAVLVTVPFLSRDFGMLYAAICLATVVPLHVRWSLLFYKSDWEKSAARISSLIKYEMLCGLAALALDEGMKWLIE